MKYDILTLQFFQEALEKIEKSGFDRQFGICDSIYHVCIMPQIRDFGYDYDLVNGCKRTTCHIEESENSGGLLFLMWRIKMNKT